MDGFVLVFFEVCTQDKSLITEFTIIKAQKHFARRCHGGLFWERKIFKIKKRASSHEDVVKESHREKHEKHEK